MKQNKNLQEGENNIRKAVTRKKWALPIIAASALIVTFVIAVALAAPDSRENTASQNEVHTPVLTDQDLVIKTDEISQTAKFYPIEIDGTRLEVMAVKAPDGTIRTAFNTCQVCYDSGRGYYKQQGDVLVCQNCGNQFPMDRVETEAGGCNPWPIFAENKTVTDKSVTISYDFLKESKSIFAHWKDSV